MPDSGKAPPGYRWAGNLTDSDRGEWPPQGSSLMAFNSVTHSLPVLGYYQCMLRLMVFCLVLSFVLLMDGMADAAMVAFVLAVAAPFVYIGWHVLAE